MTDVVTEFSEATGLFKRKTRFAYYLALVGIHVYMNNWSREIFPSHFAKQLCYLTNMSFYLNFIYYAYVFLLHTPLREYITNYSLIRGISKFAYTLSFVVFVLYWGMIIADPGMLNTKGIVIPFCLDIFLHGVNYLLNLIEHVYLFPKQDSHHINYLFYVLFLIFYGCLLQIVLFLYGIAIYPFVNQGLILFSIVVVIGLGLILIGDFTYRMLIKKHHHAHHHKN